MPSIDPLLLSFPTPQVVVAPLLVGAGVKGKINQAMLYGVPVVASDVAAEGMGLEVRVGGMHFSLGGWVGVGGR